MSGRPAFDLSVYVVTDTEMCGRRGVVATVRAAVAGGASMVQLRDPSATDDDLIRLGRELCAELAGTDVPLLVNDRVDLVAAIGAAGAHVGQGDTSPSEARAVLGRDALLGLSVQSVEHVRAAAGADVDYLGVGPVWTQATKTDAAVPCGPAGLRAIVRASPWPCVAIGGIDETRAAAVRATGASGVAVVSAVCAARDPRAATAALRAVWTAAA
ncbi:thiamine phosphate synthase [uncultured Jatrophihabitans sp.]|uniref:thiamine phosphate synthase n=1 Tax=uncultured Jatrophihabitans sp. TaxID=1610747 RepID=UPI0035C9A5CF